MTREQANRYQSRLRELLPAYTHEVKEVALGSFSLVGWNKPLATEDAPVALRALLEVLKEQTDAHHD